MDWPLMSPTNCPVCGDPFLVFVAYKKTARTKKDLPLYGCLSCLSFSNPSGFVEDDEILRLSLEWHKNVYERNANATRILLDQLDASSVSYQRIIDIGAGTGTLLKTAAERGATGIGYDINPLTQPYARDVNMIDVRSEYWTADTDTGSFNLMTCIMVLEHVPEPRQMIRDMVEACIRQDAALFVSVPFLDKDRWHFIHDPDHRSPNSPFFDNDMHVTHFSPAGMERILKEFGMKRIDWIRKGLWHGIVARP